MSRLAHFLEAGSIQPILWNSPSSFFSMHVPRQRVPDGLLDGVHNALLDVTAQRFSTSRVFPVTCIVIARGRLPKASS